MKLFFSILVIATMFSWPSESSDDDYNRGYEDGYDDGWYDACDEIAFYDYVFDDEIFDKLAFEGIC